MAALRRFGERPASRRKFARMSWPCSEAMLSGWNCTPWIGMGLVLQAHDQAIGGLGGHLEAVGQRRPLDDQRVVAGDLEAAWADRRTGPVVVLHLRQLAVHRQLRALTSPAVGLADRLMAEADAEQRDLSPAAFDQIEADTGLVGRARARRQHDRLRPHRQCLVDRDPVVADARRTPRRARPGSGRDCR